MTIFMLLIVPLPYAMKRKLFTFISESPIVAKLQYGMKVITKLQAGTNCFGLTLPDHFHLHSDTLR